MSIDPQDECVDKRPKLDSPAIRAALSRRRFLRYSALMAAAATTIPLLAACGGDDDEDPTATAGATEPTATTGGSTELTATTTGSSTDPTATGGAASEPTATPAGETSERGGVMITGWQIDVDTLDKDQSASSSVYWYNIYDPILELTPDLEYEGNLAEAWEISDDGLEYTITLREGLTYQDGSPVDAESVRFSFERIASPESVFPEASGGAVGEVIDDLTVKLVLPEKLASMLFKLADEWSAPLSKVAVETYGADFGRNPVGAGPFKFQEWVTSDHVTLVSYEGYRNFRSYIDNPGPPYLEELTIRVIPEVQTQLLAFEAGELNFMDLPPAEVARFREMDDFTLVQSEMGTRINWIGFNLHDDGSGQLAFLPPFDDLRVRQAAAYAINPDEIVEVVLEGVGVRNYGMMPHGNPGYTDEIQEFGFEFDPDLANQLLDEAGWVMNGDVREKDGQTLSIVLASNTVSERQRSSELIQNQLQQVGFEVELLVIEQASLIEQFGTDAFQLAFSSYGWGESDIIFFVGNDSVLLVTGDFGLYSQEYQELVEAAYDTFDQDERAQLYFEAQKILLQEAVCVPLFTSVRVTATRNDVQGFKLGAQGAWNFQDAYVVES